MPELEATKNRYKCLGRPAELGSQAVSEHLDVDPIARASDLLHEPLSY